MTVLLHFYKNWD